MAVIESLIRREGGTEVELQDGYRVKKYLFAPVAKSEDERHVCVVTDKYHIKRLLAIPEAFKLTGPVDAPFTDTTSASVTRTDYDSLTKKKLLAECDKRGLKHSTSDAKRSLVTRLIADDKAAD